jgi:hypothetical protein
MMHQLYLIPIAITSDNIFRIPNGQSEAVNRRTDNTVVKRKRSEGHTTICKTLHRKLKIEQHELIENWGEVMGTRGVTLVAKPIISYE